VVDIQSMQVVGMVSRDRMAAVVQLHSPIVVAGEEPTVLVNSRVEHARAVAVAATHNRRDLREVAVVHHNRTTAVVVSVEADLNDNNAMVVARWEDRVVAEAARLGRLLARKDNHNCTDHDVDLLNQKIPALRLQ